MANRPRAEFETLYADVHRSIWAVAYARLGDANLAMELMQEAFLRLWRVWTTPERPATPRPWLVTVVRNLAEDEAKSSFRKNGTHAPEMLGGLIERNAGPVEKAIALEKRNAVWRALEKLSDLDREILTLRYAFEKNTDEIAATLGIQPAAIYMRLSRARQHLAATFGDEQP